MELINHLQLGLSVALSGENLVYCFVGAVLGTVIGVLPGIGPLATIAMLLPLTYGLSSTTSLIMLAGIYYGAQYGGSTTAILLNLPGESSTAVTTIDGYQMARQGRAGAALAAAGISSFIAGTFATLVIAVLAIPLTAVALSFGPAEYFALMVVGLASSVALASGSIIKGVSMVIAGMLLSMTGMDIYTGTERFTFGAIELSDGIDFAAVAIGMFGIGEIVRNLELPSDQRSVIAKVTRLWPSAADLRRMFVPALRGTLLGSALGILPGGGALLSSFLAYNLEKNVARDPSRFGKGAIEGVAAPEAANNAGAQTSFIPMLSLGVPSNATMALMAGALIMQGIVPGPTVVSRNPDLFWGVITSMWIGNVMLLILNLPMIGIWVKLISIRYHVLFPAILAFCSIGVYSINNSIFDLYIVLGFGLAGYFLVRMGCELPPLMLGFILGPMVEDNLRRALILSQGDYFIFMQRPVALAMLIVAVVILAFSASPRLSQKRTVVFASED